MARASSVAATILFCLAAAHAADEVPPEAQEGAKPPEGAVVLFDGTGTTHWTRAKTTDDGCLLAGPTTKGKFTDFTLHLEFMMDFDPKERKSGNSGVYLQRRYEIQILNTAHKKTPGKGDCAAIYQYKPADKNVAKPPRQWQTYLIRFQAPRWDGDKKTQSARITVYHNAVKVHDDVEVPRKTGHGQKEGPAPGPIHLQHHGNRVLFRNIWLLPTEAKGE